MAMSRRSNLLVLAASAAGVIAAGTLAMAQGTGTDQGPSAVEARLAWAKRHVELVCRPLEEQKMFDRATRCYNDVARLMAPTQAAAPSATAEASPSPAKTAPESASPPAASAPAKPRPAARPAPVRTAAVAKPIQASPAPVRAAAAPARPRPVARPLTLAQKNGPAAKPFGPVARCSGVSCLRYTLLGVGF
jgi:hypothetical protein